MANERTIPLLPCAAIDVIADFYVALGFAVTYRQLKPNPYIALKREDLELHYFAIAGFDPESSYSSCLVIVDDTEPLFEAFAAGLRSEYGRLPLTGFPRITRPRRRKNASNLSGFSVIDPSGNWIRVIRQESSRPMGEAAENSPSRLAQVLANAVVLADSKGDTAQAVKILAGSLSRDQPDSSPVERVEATVFLAELCVRSQDVDRARELLRALETVPLSESDWASAAAAQEQADELRELLADV